MLALPFVLRLYLPREATSLHAPESVQRPSTQKTAFGPEQIASQDNYLRPLNVTAPGLVYHVAVEGPAETR